MPFGITNYLILLIYLSGMAVIGLFFARKQKTTDDYFLAGRSMPWLPVAMSMYASLTSAATYIGLPGIAYKNNITFIVVAVVSPVLTPILIYLFYPVCRRLNVTTSYEYIDHRFGATPRKIVSALFLFARLGWLGTVIYAPALALSIATGIDLSLAIVLMGAFATLYTVLAGLAAVLWTDVIQFIILIGGAIWIAISLLSRIPDGFSEFLQIANAHGHIQINTSISLTEMTLIGVFIGFFFQMMQDYGTDQVTVQRLLSAKTHRGMVKAILFNACTDLFIISLLLFIGTGLFVYYHLSPHLLEVNLTKDQMLPFYIINELPNGVSGLLIAAIFAAAMSSIDSGIHSMSTVIVNDFVQSLRGSGASPRNDLKLARILTLMLGLVATCVAFYVSTLEGIIESFATFMSLFSAPVLALFLLGMLTKRGQFFGWCIGTAMAIPATYGIQHYTEVSWVYYFPFSFLVTFVISLLMMKKI